MPYIKRGRRVELDAVALSAPTNAGELNYMITKLLVSYCVKMGLNYQHINDCMGAAHGAATEFYRRVAAPYERTKVAENGDIEFYRNYSPEG